VVGDAGTLQKAVFGFNQQRQLTNDISQETSLFFTFFKNNKSITLVFIPIDSCANQADNTLMLVSLKGHKKKINFKK
jgi:hypothetical protein